MIAQWENECISLSVLSVALVEFTVVVGYFRRLPLAALHTDFERPKARTTAERAEGHTP